MKFLTFTVISLASLTMAAGSLNLGSEEGSITNRIICSKLKEDFRRIQAGNNTAELKLKDDYKHYLGYETKVQIATDPNIKDDLRDDALNKYQDYEREYQMYKNQYNEYVRALDLYNKQCKNNLPKATIYDKQPRVPK